MGTAKMKTDIDILQKQKQQNIKKQNTEIITIKKSREIRKIRIVKNKEGYRNNNNEELQRTDKGEGQRNKDEEELYRNNKKGY